MILTVFLSLATLAFAQYHPQTQQRGYQPQGYAPQQYQQPPAGAYQPQPAHQPQPVYQPQPQQRSYNPAAVHYVNIGAQLQGDYKFGYDTGKGNDGQSFREETRLPDGSVQGAYGYIDASGKQRIVRYTAGKDGYKAEGDVGPDGVPRGIAPGPAPQPVANPHPSQPSGHPPANNNYLGGGYPQY